jgi:predicted TIM-barrel fold metal-dependent hydrolase
MDSYNIHTHVFTMNNAPRKFLELYLPKMAASAVDIVTNTQVGSWLVRTALMKLGGAGGKRYASFLQIGKSSNQNNVFRHMIDSYEDTSMKMVALTLYMEKLGAEASMSGYEGQLEEIITLKKRYPERLLPFLCVDPRWKGNGIALRNTVERYFGETFVANNKEYSPFVGLKIYPSSGFYPFDERLKPVMEWAAEHRVPIMTHCAYLGGIYCNDADFVKASLNPRDPYNNMYYKTPCYISDHKKARVNNLRSCSYFLEPCSYESMIRYFAVQGKPLKICFAHYGGDQHMLLEHKGDMSKAFYGTRPGHNWCRQIKDLMQYEGVYTDISYSLSNKDTYDFIFEELQSSRWDRLMFGTDFFMTEREQAERLLYTEFKSSALARPAAPQTGLANAWEQIAQRNTAAFLESDFYPKTD